MVNVCSRRCLLITKANWGLLILFIFLCFIGSPCPAARRDQGDGRTKTHAIPLSLYKILFHFEALLWESIMLALPPPPPTCNASPIAIQLHDHCVIYAPHRPPLCMPYTTLLVMAILCKGQPPRPMVFTNEPDPESCSSFRRLASPCGPSRPRRC